MALGSTQPLTEMSTRSISWGVKRPVRKVDNLPPSCAVVTKSGSLKFLEPSGPVQACNGTHLSFYWRKMGLIFRCKNKSCESFITSSRTRHLVITECRKLQTATLRHSQVTERS